MIRVEFVGLNEMIRAIEDYEQKVLQAVQEVANYIQPVMESYAKQEAPWQDRTSNARQSLHSWVDPVAKDIVDIWLSHGVDYGVYLEQRWQGRWAIVYPTLEAHFEIILQMLQGIFE
jgi:hypothetical protein